ncbi:MAG: NAD(P)H-dependent oxidoreductase [Clostridia bacterium]|nr:NAD(P)H-dependent oxidoreductase [Clostridia bacterium]
MKTVLFVNACVRKGSRTLSLAKYLLEKLDGNICEEKLEDLVFPQINERFLELRDGLVKKREFDDPIFSPANRFAEADEIVVAAPFWDLSFPSILKQYFEQINVLGITFTYSRNGIPQSLCKAGKLYYVATAGGFIAESEYGFGYVNALAKGFYGINETHFIKAEGLDIDGANVDEIIANAKKDIDSLF